MPQSRLAVRLLGFTVIAFAVVGGLLFGSAGSLGWREAWVYLTILFALMLFGASYLMIVSPELVERRLRAREKEVPQQFIAKLGLVALGLEYILAGLDFRFGWADAPLPVVVAGDTGAFVGYCVSMMALRENRWAARTVAVEQDQTVISSGPYALVRHPMYLGAMLLYGSTPLALGSYWALIPALMLVALLVTRTLNEEQVLLRDLPGYRAYVDRVRWRLVPWIW